MNATPLRRIGLLLLLVLASLPGRAHAAFVDISAGLTGAVGPVAWGDFDNDGDLDLASAGNTTVGTSARIYRNNNGVFVDAGSLAGGAIGSGAVAWGDYDKDGDLDLAICGDVGGGSGITRIYRNNAGVFADLGAGLQGVVDGDVAWGDLDNDGDLDLAVAGWTGAIAVGRIYRNTGGVFADAGAGLATLRHCHFAWGDYDKDGDVDLAYCGDSLGTSMTLLYANNGGVLQRIAPGMPGIDTGWIEWGDYDADGDPDLLSNGASSVLFTYPRADVWQNSAGSFTLLSSTGIQAAAGGTSAWGDYDNDGDQDVALCGYTASDAHDDVFRNDAGSFVNINAGLPPFYDSRLAWGDYDHDGDLDLAVSGTDLASKVTRIFRNSGVPLNAVPAAPTGMYVTGTATMVTFHWNPSTDAQGAGGLSYNLWVGHGASLDNIMPAQSNLSNGFRRLPKVGNVGQRTDWSIQRAALGAPPIYWGVQAVDAAFAGSPFSSALLGVDDREPGSTLALRSTGPNPFEAEARFAYTLPRASRVTLEVLDVTGRRVRTLVDGERSAGDHTAAWEGVTDDGRRTRPGVYLVRLRAGEATASLRVLEVE